MKLRKSALLWAASLCLWFATASNAELTESGDPCSPQQIFSAGSSMHSLVLVSSVLVVLEDGTLGNVVAYDDPTTKRPADYCKLNRRYSQEET